VTPASYSTNRSKVLGYGFNAESSSLNIYTVYILSPLSISEKPYLVLLNFDWDLVADHSITSVDIIPLSDDGKSVIGKRESVFFNDDVSCPYFYQRGNYQYLFHSIYNKNRTAPDAGYSLYVARSDSARGPFEFREEPLLSKTGQFSEFLWPSIIDDTDGKDVMFLETTINDTEKTIMLNLVWDEEGWPAVVNFFSPCL